MVVLDDHQQVAAGTGPWDRLGPDLDLVCVPGHVADEDALVRLLAGAAVVVAMRERTAFPERLLARLPDLRLLVTTGGKNVAIDVAAARARGVVVCGTGSLTSPTVEHTWALLLALARGVPAEERHLRAGGWQLGLGTDLEGGTLGVVGLGRLGSRVAAVGQAFGMRVVAWSQNLDPDAARAAGVEPVTKSELFERSDVVTLHLVLSDRSRGVVGAVELAAMRPGALLVNTSRGPLVDEAALVSALHGGRLGGAALDVYDVEPLPADSPLRTAPRLVLSPHLGYVTRGSYEVFFRDVVEDIAGWLAGSPLREL